MAATKRMDRREFIVTTLTVGGGFALALAFPRSQAEGAVNAAKIPDKPRNRSWEMATPRSTLGSSSRRTIR